MSGTWRPINIGKFDAAAMGVLNQGHRETNIRIDNIVAVLNQRIGTNNASLNFGTVAANSSVDRTLTLVGARRGLVAHASPSLPLAAGLTWSSWVSGANQVTVRLGNSTVGGLTPPVIKWSIVCT